MNIRKIVITGAAAVALVAGGTAVGAVTIDTNSVYKGCVVGTSRTLEHVYTQANPPACPSGSFRATWGGPPTAGPNGLDLTTVQDTETGVTLDNAICPSSEPYVVSGGYQITGATVAVIDSYPNAVAGTGSWTVLFAAPTDATVYAVCSR